MDKITSFSATVSAQLKRYVYRLIDPRNGTTFYVGRGRDNRVFAHARDAIKATEDDDLKLATIRAIIKAGLEVEYLIHRHGLDEKTVIEVEAALIDAYPGLSNLVKGTGSGDFGMMHVNEIVQKYEAPFAEFYDDVILVNVNRSSDDLNLYDAVRYAWVVSRPKAEAANYVLAVRRGLIIGAYKAEKWLNATPENFPGFPATDPKRWGFVGHEASDAIKACYVGKRAPTQKPGAANPIRYQKAENAQSTSEDQPTYNPEDKFAWGPGDIQFVSHGEGPTLAELTRQYEEAEKAAVKLRGSS